MRQMLVTQDAFFKRYICIPSCEIHRPRPNKCISIDWFPYMNCNPVKSLKLLHVYFCSVCIAASIFSKLTKYPHNLYSIHPYNHKAYKQGPWGHYTIQSNAKCLKWDDKNKDTHGPWLKQWTLTKRNHKRWLELITWIVYSSLVTSFSSELEIVQHALRWTLRIRPMGQRTLGSWGSSNIATMSSLRLAGKACHFRRACRLGK